MPFDVSLIGPAVERYRRERDRYIKLADRIAEICRNDICLENAVRAQVTFRVKSIKSFEGKLNRFQRKANKNFQNEDEIFSEISDLAGVRIATYRKEDLKTVVEAVKRTFSGPAGGDVVIDEKDRSIEDPTNFYVATHAQVALPEEEMIGTYDNLSDVTCEIQICTMMAHVWNEIEHDIGYKPEGEGPSGLEKGLLVMLGHSVRAGDEMISQLLAANASQEGPADAEFKDVHDFVTRVRTSYDVQDFAKHSGNLYNQIGLLGIKSPVELSKKIGSHNQAKVSVLIGLFNDFLVDKGDSKLKMDPQSSDVVLIQLLDKNLSQVLESHKGLVGHGKGAPSRPYRLAKRYQDFVTRNATA